MKPVVQTKFEDGANALDACIASVLELPLEQVPHFNGEGADWVLALDQFVRRFGCSPVVIEQQALRYICWLSDVYSIASGRSERGDMHSVVWLGNKMVHDPHPDRTGLMGDPLSFTLFVMLDPARTDSVSVVSGKLRKVDALDPPGLTPVIK